MELLVACCGAELLLDDALVLFLVVDALLLVVAACLALLLVGVACLVLLVEELFTGVRDVLLEF